MITIRIELREKGNAAGRVCAFDWSEGDAKGETELERAAARKLARLFALFWEEEMKRSGRGWMVEVADRK